MSGKASEVIDTDTQLEWMRAEMQHGHEKTAGFDEKLRRLRQHPDDTESVLTFMTSYWGRFSLLAREADEQPEQQLVDLAKNQIGKVACGMADKAAMALSLAGPGGDMEHIDAVLEVIQLELDVDETIKQVIDMEIELAGGITSIAQQKFRDTSLGRHVLAMHQFIMLPEKPNEFDPHFAIYRTGVAAAETGMFMWQAYLDHVVDLGLDPTMPQPGVPGGAVEPWVRN